MAAKIKITTVITLRKWVCSLQAWQSFGPSDPPAEIQSKHWQPSARPFTINWRNQRNWAEQPLGKLSLLIYYIKRIIYCHSKKRRKKKKKNGRIRIGWGSYKTTQNGGHITQTKRNSDHQSHRKWGPPLTAVGCLWSLQPVTQEVGSGDSINHHVLPLSLQHLHLVTCTSNVRPWR